MPDLRCARTSGCCSSRTDPERDTPDVVRDYLDRFDPPFEGLVAPVDDVARAARALYISYEKPDGSTGGSYVVDHGTYTTAFVRGKARLVWSDDHDGRRPPRGPRPARAGGIA